MVNAGLGTAQYPPFTNNGNNPVAPRPKLDADNSGRCSDIGSNGGDSNSCSSGPRSNTDSIVHGNNKRKQAPEESRQPPGQLQTVAAVDFSYYPKLLNVRTFF